MLVPPTANFQTQHGCGPRTSSGQAVRLRREATRNTTPSTDSTHVCECPDWVNGMWGSCIATECAALGVAPYTTMSKRPRSSDGAVAHLVPFSHTPFYLQQLQHKNLLRKRATGSTACSSGLDQKNKGGLNKQQQQRRPVCSAPAIATLGRHEMREEAAIQFPRCKTYRALAAKSGLSRLRLGRFVQLVPVACQACGLAASPLRDQVHGRGHALPRCYGPRPAGQPLFLWGNSSLETPQTREQVSGQVGERSLGGESGERRQSCGID